MTENDYIAEYIKEKHPTLLGLDFAFWKMGKMAVNASNRIARAFNNMDWSKSTFSNEEENDNDNT